MLGVVNCSLCSDPTHGAKQPLVLSVREQFRVGGGTSTNSYVRLLPLTDYGLLLLDYSNNQLSFSLIISCLIDDGGSVV